MENKMVLEEKYSIKEIFILECTLMESSMEKENFKVKTDIYKKEYGWMDNFRRSDYIYIFIKE